MAEIEALIKAGRVYKQNWVSWSHVESELRNLHGDDLFTREKRNNLANLSSNFFKHLHDALEHINNLIPKVAPLLPPDKRAELCSLTELRGEDFLKQWPDACGILLAANCNAPSSEFPLTENDRARGEIESLRCALPNGSLVHPESVTGDATTTPVAAGVSVFDAAVHFEDGDQAAATKLVKVWSDKRTPKPSNLGNDPEDGRRKLSELSDILDYVGEVSGGLMPGEKRKLRNHLRTRLRKPR